VDEERGEYYVANDADHSILVFNIEDTGNVAPRRVIRGERTQIRNPMGVYLDAKNNELWVSNMGNHRATVFDRTANGNVAPKRVIRSAPSDKLALTIGNPGAVGYDSKREEILVPN
jgi:DNA-binding beta-propeller fold protein YncE